MSRLLVFTATKMEGRVVQRMMDAKTYSPQAGGTTIGKIGNNEIAVVSTGMGPLNAAAAARDLLKGRVERHGHSNGEFSPDAVIITGLAGSLAPVIAEADIVLYEKCLSESRNRESIHLSPEMIESIAQSLEIRGLNSRKAIGITSSRIARLDQDRQSLAQAGAAVVDMESFEIAACAVNAGIPVAVMRVISDSPGSRLPDLNRALTDRGEFDRWVLAAVLAASPIATARLFKASRRAIAALERAIFPVLSEFGTHSGLPDAQAPHSRALQQV